MSEIFLIHATGEDKPGHVATLTGVLSHYDAHVLDIGQAVIHNYITLGILATIPEKHRSSAVIKDLLYTGHNLGLTINFTPVDPEAYERWAANPIVRRYKVTLLGRCLTATQISWVAAAVAELGLNIDVVTRLSGRPSVANPAHAPIACVELSVSGDFSHMDRLRTRFMQISQDAGVDISFHQSDIYHRNRRLVVFDMDSTLIRTEVIDELAQLVGVGDRVAAITAAAMNGEMDFSTSLRERVALLKGLSEEALATVAADLPLTEGAERAVGILQRLGYKIGVISGGFDYFGRRLQQRLGLDYMFANRLEIADGRLTGRIAGDIVDGRRKADLLRELANRENIRLEQTIAVGDGANDLPMLNIAGLGVAFHAKPAVKRQAQNGISEVGLDGLLYLLGISEQDIRQER